jgi:hypothetical protein
VDIGGPYYYTGVWTAALACALTAALHWRLAAHAPTAPPDVVAPATVPAFIQGPIVWAVDAVNTVGVGRDVALASWLIVAAVAGATTAWTRRLGVPAWLATALGVGITFLPHTWSTQAPGRDAIVLLAMLAFAAWLSTPRAERPHGAGGLLVAAGGLLLVAHYPPTLWWLAPVALASGHVPTRVGARWLLIAIGTAVGASLAYAWGLTHGSPCLVDSAAGSTTLWTLLRPAVTAHVGLTDRLAAAGAATVTELHVFGVAAAAWAVWLAGHAHPAARRVTLAGTASLVVGTALGTMPPRLVVLAATVAWLPWFAIACHRLLSLAPSRRSMLTRVAVCWLVLGLPIARHAVFVPDPLATAAPAVWTAAYAQLDDVAIAAAVEGDARLARQAGRILVPAHAQGVSACLARGTTVMAVGPAVETLRYDGVVVDDVPVTAPLAALADDLRPDAVVALAVTTAGARWLPPADVPKVAAIGASEEALRRRSAQAVVTQLPAAPSTDVVAHAPSTTAATSRVDDVDERRLWHPLSVDVQPGAVAITAGATSPQPIVLGETAAIAVFDRTERPVIRASAAPLPRLPMPLYSALPALRLGRVVEVASDRAAPRARPFLPAELPPPVDAETAATVPVHVGAGWHDAEPAGRLAFRWSAGQEATAVFRLTAPTRLVVTVHASPARTKTHDNALHLRINGVPLARDLDGARTIDVPASATHAGLNTLTFETDGVVPAGTIPGEPRTLAAVVHHLRVVRR